MRERTKEAADRMVELLEGEFDVSSVHIEEYWDYTDGKTDPESVMSAEIELIVVVPFEDENPYRVR